MDTSNLKSRSFLALASRGAGVGLKFLYTLLLAKLLGARDMGLYTLALSVASAGAMISEFGFENPAVRLTAKYSISQNLAEIRGLLILVSVCVLSLGLVIIFFLIVGADFISTSIFHNPELSAPLLLIAGSVVTVSFFNIFNSFLRGMGLGERAVFLQNVFVPLCGILIFLLMFYFGGRAQGASMAYFFSYVAGMVCSLLLVARSINVRAAGKYPSIKEVMHDSLQFFCLNIVNNFQNWMGVYIVGILMAAEDVGIFRAASSMSIMISLPLLSVNDILPPAIVKLHAASELSSLQRVLMDNTRWIMAVSLPIFVVLMLFPQYILSLLGKDFASGEYVLVVLAAGYFFNSFMGTIGLVLRMTDNQKYVIRARTFVFIASIGLYYYLTKAYGVTGAAFAATAAIVAMNVWNAISMRKLLGIRSYTFDLGDLLLAAAAAAVVMILVKASFGNTFFALLVFSLTYLFMTRKTIFRSTS